MDYEGPERRNIDKMFHDLDTRFMTVENALRAVIENAEGRHKRTNDKFDEITEHIMKLNRQHWGDGNGIKGVSGRLQHLEDMQKMSERSYSKFNTAMYWAIGLLFTLEGLILLKLFT